MNYIAIVGDIKESKKLEDRKKIQLKIYNVLNQINQMFSADISARFIITLGDEFQGLLKEYGHLLDIIKFIQREMYPVKMRFGIGIGEISTVIFHEAALGADGPAYYAARSMIEELREQEKKLKKHASDIQIDIYNTKDFETTQINIILSLMKVIEDEWTDNQRYTIWDMEQNGGSQEKCAKRMNTTQSTIARRLADGKYVIYEKAKEIVNEALKRLGEI